MDFGIQGKKKILKPMPHTHQGITVHVVDLLFIFKVMEENYIHVT